MMIYQNPVVGLSIKSRYTKPVRTTSPRAKKHLYHVWSEDRSKKFTDMIVCAVSIAQARNTFPDILIALHLQKHGTLEGAIDGMESTKDIMKRLDSYWYTNETGKANKLFVIDLGICTNPKIPIGGIVALEGKLAPKPNLVESRKASLGL